MSHFDDLKNQNTEADRNLGDEWVDWNGNSDNNVEAGKSVFLLFSAKVLLLMGIASFAFIYLITPRLTLWHPYLPYITWVLFCGFCIFTLTSFVQLILTAKYEKNFFFNKFQGKILFDLYFEKVFKLGMLLGISKDKMGNSFVKVSNSLARAWKKCSTKEKLLILLPRCLTKEKLKEIRDLQEIYPVEVHVVSGGELARKKVREIRPTAVIGVACERDLVSGIRDVGGRFSVIGIPNKRPDGPCKNTCIEMKDLIDAIEFYVGKNA
ncbi:MAG: DUF116 domain-containing protein [Pseudomonadota bacterium]